MLDHLLDQTLTYGFRLLARGIIVIRPVLPVICALAAWGLLAIVISQIASTLRATLHGAQTLHRIPCSHCQYATDNRLLKCSVHPVEAFSEAAIACEDFRPADS